MFQPPVMEGATKYRNLQTSGDFRLERKRLEEEANGSKFSLMIMIWDVKPSLLFVSHLKIPSSKRRHA